MKKSKKVVEQTTPFPSEMDWSHFSPVEVIVGNNFEKSFRLFKSMVQAERIIADYRQRGSYEKPSEKKRRKHQETMRRLMEEASKNAKIADGSYEKEKMKKLEKKERRMKERGETKSND